MNVLGVHLLGLTRNNAHHLALTVFVLIAAVAVRYAIVGIVRPVTGEQPNERVVFWTRQGVSLATTVVVVLALLSIWFEDTQRLATFAGLIGAGLAFAMQKAVTAFAGYLVILRGRTFTVGDRITMGGVRGDVISLGFLQTRIMEMGEPPPVAGDPSTTWVFARQYTGRVVTVTNDKVFTLEFQFIWDEIRIPISYQSDYKRAEEILLETARELVEPIQDVGEPAKQAMEKKYFLKLDTLEPQVFYTAARRPQHQGSDGAPHSRTVREGKDRDRQRHV